MKSSQLQITRFEDNSPLAFAPSPMLGQLHHIEVSALILAVRIFLDEGGIDAACTNDIV